MKAEDILQLRSTPLSSPSYPAGPYRFVDREYMTITYETDPAIIREHLPEPLVPNAQNIVVYEWIKMPDSSGFGYYTESGLVIPATLNGEDVSYVSQMYLDDQAPIAAGREIWGFPKKLANVSFKVETDTLLGTLDYGRIRIATGTMGYKYKTLDSNAIAKAMVEPGFLLKIVPHVDCTPRICELVRYYLEDVTVKGAWTGPAGLELSQHALAPLAELPVLEVISAAHFVADLTLGLGEVVHDYMK
jgi:acetoacetate decarboxylase